MGLNADTALYLVGAPLWVAVLIYAIRTAKDWPGIMDKWNERQRDKAKIEADQDARWDARMLRIEESEADCQRRLTDALRRIAKLEGFDEGQGAARELGQMIVSSERQKDAKAREGKG